MSKSSKFYSRYSVTGTEIDQLLKIREFFAGRDQFLVAVSKTDPNSVSDFEVTAVFNKDSGVSRYQVVVAGDVRITDVSVISKGRAA